jgi:hypothetical protein
MIYLLKFIYADKSTDVKYFKTLNSLVLYMLNNQGWMDRLLSDYALFECRSVRREVNKMVKVLKSEIQNKPQND